MNDGNNSDIVSLHNFKVSTIIGAYTWERQVKQTLSIDMDLTCQADEIAKTDDLQHAVDYAKLAEETSQFIQASQFKLIETLAEQTAQFILNTFAVSWIRLRVNKFGAIAHADKVSVTIERFK